MDIILSAKGISKTYTAGQVKINALNRCDIEVRKGEFTAIVGKSGSGKSTLLRILGTMDKPDEGKVYIAGKDISNLKNSELAKFRRTHIGFIYQDYKLIPEYTAYENDDNGGTAVLAGNPYVFFKGNMTDWISKL